MPPLPGSLLIFTFPSLAFFRVYFYYVYTCAGMCTWVQMPMEIRGVRPQELESQLPSVNGGPALGSSPTCWAISPAPVLGFFFAFASQILGSKSSSTTSELLKCLNFKAEKYLISSQFTQQHEILLLWWVKLSPSGPCGLLASALMIEYAPWLLWGGASLGKIHIALNNTDRNDTHYPLLLIPLQNTPESSLSKHCLIDLLQKLNFVYYIFTFIKNKTAARHDESRIPELRRQSKKTKSKGLIRASWDPVSKQYSLQKQCHKRPKHHTCWW